MKGNLLFRNNFYDIIFFEIGDIPFNGLLILQIILILFMCYLGFKLSRFIRSVELEKRLKPFSLINEVNDSWHLMLLNGYTSFLKRLVFRFRDSVFLNKWADKYVPYINSLNSDIKNPLVLVMNQIVMSFICLMGMFIVEILNSHLISSEIILLSGLLGFITPWIFYHFVYLSYKNRVRDDILNLIKRILPYLDSKSLTESIKSVLPLFNDQIRLEFKEVIKEIDLGLDISDCFDRLYRRTRIFEIKLLSESIRRSINVGGSMYDAFEMAYSDILEVRRYKKDYLKKTKNLRWLILLILSIPIVLSIIFYSLDANYFAILYNTSIGRLILLVILVLYIGYALMILEVLKAR